MPSGFGPVRLHGILHRHALEGRTKPWTTYCSGKKDNCGENLHFKTPNLFSGCVLRMSDLLMKGKVVIKILKTKSMKIFLKMRMTMITTMRNFSE